MILGIDGRNGDAVLKCERCGRQFDTQVDLNAMREPDIWPMLKSMLEKVVCDDCARLAQEENRRAEQASMEVAVIEACVESGIPQAMASGSVYNQSVANWLWMTTARVPSNALVTGASGTGKTTSACACLHRLVASGHQVRYWRSLGDFSNEYLNAKRGTGDSLARFWRTMGRLRVLAVDEVSDSSSSNPLAREALFALVDRAYSGDLRGVWLLGNLVQGSLDGMADDPSVLRRRLRESFRCGIVHSSGQIAEARP